jgi:CHAT domain
MKAPAKINPLLVEFHRFGGSDGVPRDDDCYIRTAGWEDPARVVRTELTTEQFFDALGALRGPQSKSEGVKAALNTVAAQAAKMFAGLRLPKEDTLVQIDLVTHASELWAFPFESWMDPTPVFANRERKVTLTRRIRGAFTQSDFRWPSEPRVLFAHAPVASDLSQSLIDDHVAALERALLPWTKGKKLGRTNLLTVRTARGPWDLDEAREETVYTHIHILAHGGALEDAKVPGRLRWGLRFGEEEKSRPTDPQDIADVLQPRNGLPAVVSLAACDSANQPNLLAGASLAQELHERGIPVIIASQPPLTKQGSTLMTEHFYERALPGDDVRAALHEVRVKLYELSPQTHDWLSLVAYVRLPNRYDERFEEVKLRANLTMLEAAHHASLAKTGDGHDTSNEVETRIRDRIDDLQQQYTRLDPDKRRLHEECVGLLASAHKRLAELQFAHAETLSETDARARRTASRESLESAWRYFRQTFRQNIHSHWMGSQQLCLEAVLTGKLSHPFDWYAALRAAELECEESRKCKYWGFVSFAELQLLAPVTGQERNLNAVRQALETFKERARESNSQDIELTRRQFRRYVNWWTNANGFFPNRVDLADDVRQVLSVFD